MSVGIFFLYGVYSAATEGIAKAWISNIIDKKDTATAIGTFSGMQSICALIASSMTGVIWFQFSPTAAFLTTGFVSFGLMFYFLMLPNPANK